MPDTDDRTATSLGDLADDLQGTLLRPGEEGYNDARAVWNGMADRRPAAIAMCESTHDVAAALTVAREADRSLSVKGGGHHVSGRAVAGDLVLDLALMDAVSVDPEARTATVGPGALWGDVDEATVPHDLVVPGPQDPSVGVAGATLGGGGGWLSPTFGFTSDNLRRAEVVTAEGGVVEASDDANPDLFWALRGGGGNFGVVTEFEFRLHEFDREVLAGSVAYDPAEAPEVIEHYERFMDDAPRAVRPLFGLMELPPAPVYPEHLHGERVLLLILFYGGDPGEGADVLEPLRSFGDPLADSVRPRDYLDWQRVGEASAVRRSYVRGAALDTYSEGAVETILEYGTDAPSPEATIFSSPRRGAETDPPVDATAYPHRTDVHYVLAETRWDDPARDEENLGWARAFGEAMEPHANGEQEVNFLTDDQIPERVPDAFGPNYGRLVDVKRRWDPENVFSNVPNVVPDGG